MCNLTPYRKPTTTTIHVMALDGIIHVNSLFTLGLFLGLSLYPDPSTTLVSVSCSPPPAVFENLVAFHVYSFSSFLFSSLIASALKQAIKFTNGGAERDLLGIGLTMAEVNLMLLRIGILLSGVGSVSGCGCLTMALVNLVQVKLGVLDCKSFHTLAAICPLVTLVPVALVIYVCLVFYAFVR
ncbi:uncharacterized protein LOC123224954 [Mangifera indica]|uniref:uncharacterized protein LOC123224954 n=1 Tax=Mangifera indica TaxID=29780 RepID=UPI001CF9A1BD|nr:uncharacterized protein LOC123224954 [Mangifera indica]